jgi:predicted dithiol-disulfide oxidoreductase (DUF899 family)
MTRKAAAATRTAEPAPSPSWSVVFTHHQAEAIMVKHEIVSEEKWIEARRALLAEEKAWTHERDRLSKKRRALPWVKVEKNYLFEGPKGPVTLAELFDGRSQLIVYHFMFGPDWDEGCSGCSLLSDQIDGARQHFEHNDVSFVAVSRAPIEKLEAYPQTDGLEVPLGLLGRQRFQFRLPRVLPRGHAGQGSVLQFRAKARSRGGRAAGRQRLL